jgi:nitrile hydratase subunit beta
MTVRSHDLGGSRGFGPIPIEQDEPVWHAPWEGSVVAGILATIGAGLYNVDQFREAIDDLEPLSYISVGYYGRWLHTLEENCVRAGVFTPEQVAEAIGHVAAGSRPTPTAGTEVADGLRRLIREGAPGARTVERPPCFTPGDLVRGRMLPDERHARIPGYVQGRPGVIHRVHDAFANPDTHRRGEGENPEHVYSVRFEGADLWPGTGEGEVFLDLWESYLERREAA